MNRNRIVSPGKIQTLRYAVVEFGRTCLPEETDEVKKTGILSSKRQRTSYLKTLRDFNIICLMFGSYFFKWS